jgi:hypothetical protein
LVQLTLMVWLTVENALTTGAGALPKLIEGALMRALQRHPTRQRHSHCCGGQRRIRPEIQAAIKLSGPVYQAARHDARADWQCC